MQSQFVFENSRSRRGNQKKGGKETGKHNLSPTEQLMTRKAFKERT